MPHPDSEWFLPAFVVVWLSVCGTLSIVSGWYYLAERYKSGEPIDGERFRFRSGAIGWNAFPVNYGGCLFATVGAKGFALSILFPFRFLHPRLMIPWSDVERCEPTKYWFKKRVAVHVTGFDRRFLFQGSLGEKLLEAWAQARRSS